jgi:hypothetical protein
MSIIGLIKIMLIKPLFKLISNTPNIINLNHNIIQSFYDDVNSIDLLFSLFEVKKNNFIHFTNKKIFNMNKNIIKIINFDYPLPVTYNIPTKEIIINLNYFNVKEISSMNTIDIYACIVYGYIFKEIVTKKYKISESYLNSIVNFFLSFYMRIFGKKYGLVSTYSLNILKLKFLLTCYILSSYYGYEMNNQFFNKVLKIAPYDYFNEIINIQNYNFQDITQFIKSLSDLKVMPGISVTSFTSTIYRFYGITILAAIEDCARFFSLMLTLSISGTTVVPRYIIQANKIEYFNIVNEIKRGLFL